MNTIIEIVTIMTLLFSNVYGSGFIVSMAVDVQGYSSYEELYETADAVIICTVDSSRVIGIDLEESAEYFDAYTVSTVKIDTVIKGSVKEGDYLNIMQYGGFYNNKYYVQDHSELLYDKSRYLLFLGTNNNLTAYLLNHIQGMYYVTGTEITPRTGNDINISYEQLFSE